MSNVMGLGGGAFRRWLGHEDETTTNGTSALTKEAPENSLAPSYHVNSSEKTSLPPKRGPSPEPNHAGTLIMDFQPLKL